MSTKLQRHNLSSLIDVKRGQSISGEYYASEGEHIRLTLANFDYVNGGFKADSQKDDLFYTGPIKPECLLNEGDIITPLTEQALGLLGSTARIPESGKYVQSGDIALVTCKEGLLDPNFCYYLLPSKQVKKQLAAGSQQTKIRHTSPDAIKACVVDIPDFEQQKKIGEFLSLLDRKISLNRAINENLEALAKQIYDYWFVQFDFPNEEGKPYKSSGGAMVWNEKLKRKIPEGWINLKLKDVLTCNVESVQPGEHLKDLNYCPIDEIPIRRMSFAGGKSWEEAKSSLQLYNKKEILIGAMRVYFHRCCISSEKGVTRTTTLVLVPKEESHLSYLYQLCNEDRTFEYATRVSTGTQQPYVTWDALSLYDIPFPNNTNIIEKYCSQTNSIINEVLSNEIEICNLLDLRNFILPILMNGQVTIE